MYNSGKLDCKKKIEAVIFDLDGTLLDTLVDLKNAVNAALAQFHMPERTLEEIRTFVGNGVRNLMIQSVPEGKNNPDFEEALSFFTQYYKAHCKENTGPYPGVLQMMKALSDKGIPMGVVSNKLDPAVKELCQEYFGSYIQVAIGELPGMERKPAPGMVNMALDMLGAKKEQAIYVGDSEVDIQTAGNAGLDCVCVTWGFRDEEFLRECGGAVFIHKPEELLECTN
jgi:phosphoglycolate phosphatase